MGVSRGLGSGSESILGPFLFLCELPGNCRKAWPTYLALHASEANPGELQFPSVQDSSSPKTTSPCVMHICTFHKRSYS